MRWPWQKRLEEAERTLKRHERRLQKADEDAKELNRRLARIERRADLNLEACAQESVDR